MSFGKIHVAFIGARNFSGEFRSLNQLCNMKTPFCIYLSLAVVSNLLAQASSPVLSPKSPTNPSPGYSVVDRGAHHRVWATASFETNLYGRIIVRTNSYTELETGMHYWADGQWKESQELIESYPGGAIARQGQHKVIFAANLATPGAIDVETAAGTRLRSHVLGLSYFGLDSRICG